jgi:hypothetical protein
METFAGNEASPWHSREDYMKKTALVIALIFASTGTAVAQWGGGYGGERESGYSERGHDRGERAREYERRYGGGGRSRDWDRDSRRRDCRTYVTRERDRWGNIETRRVERCR